MASTKSELGNTRREKEMKRLTYLLLVGVVLLSLGSGNASAQATASGTIQGTITDKSGAVVTGAQVVAKNKATDISRTTTSSDTGDYRFELLPVGNYTVTVTGVDNKDHSVGGPVMQLALEAVQEFVISAQRFSAVNGRSEGGGINMITKQGTNDYPGSVFGCIRDTNRSADQKYSNGTRG